MNIADCAAWQVRVDRVLQVEYNLERITEIFALDRD